MSQPHDAFDTWWSRHYSMANLAHGAAEDAWRAATEHAAKIADGAVKPGESDFFWGYSPSRPYRRRADTGMSETAPEYPGFGSPCNGCGFCCAAEPCEIARDFAGFTDGPCPAMEFESGRFVCGIVKAPSRYIGTPEFSDGMLGAMFAEALGIGKGCDREV